MTTATGRPRVICHMTTSLDGRIVVDGWPDTAAVRREYERVHASYESDGWMCGRVTMEPFAGGTRPEAEVAHERAHERAGSAPREDFRAPGEFDSFAFAIDARGRLAWETSDIEGDHVVAVLTERVSDAYLAFLRDRGVSYLLAGTDPSASSGQAVDLPLALAKIGARFGVRTLMLEGGGKLNGAMLRAGLIDEVSLLVAPVADGRTGTPALFDVAGADPSLWSGQGDDAPRRLSLQGVERRAADVLWLRYHVDGAAPR